MGLDMYAFVVENPTDEKDEVVMELSDNRPIPQEFFFGASTTHCMAGWKNSGKSFTKKNSAMDLKRISTALIFI